jgi:hypothetical protein
MEIQVSCLNAPGLSGERILLLDQDRSRRDRRQHESDARRFLEDMRERLGKFALSLHPEKTRLTEFGRFAAERRERRDSANRRPSTSWASLSSAGKLARASSRLNGKPEQTACGRSSR